MLSNRFFCLSYNVKCVIIFVYCFVNTKKNIKLNQTFKRIIENFTDKFINPCKNNNTCHSRPENSDPDNGRHLTGYLNAFLQRCTPYCQTSLLYVQPGQMELDPTFNTADIFLSNFEVAKKTISPFYLLWYMYLSPF